MAQAGPNTLIRSSTISCHSESEIHLKEGANELRPQRPDSEIAGLGGRPVVGQARENRRLVKLGPRHSRLKRS